MYRAYKSKTHIEKGRMTRQAVGEDKIIQIISKEDGIYGLSESGGLYFFNTVSLEKLEWEPLIGSPTIYIPSDE